MNTKRIWMLAIIFGAIMSFIFYIVTTNNGNTNGTATEETVNEDVSETVPNEETTTNILEITSGKRAISIAVDQVTSVSGFVQPGSFVDIIAAVPAQNGGTTTAQVLLENIRVLAVGKTASGENEEIPDSYEMVTLEVTPQQGTSLTQARAGGTITLMLRGNQQEKPGQS